MLPLQEKLDIFLDHNKIGELLNSQLVRALPINFLRGVDWQNKCVIIDEAQNLSVRELKTIMTRIGENCKVFIIGDKSQSDIGSKTGFHKILTMFKGPAHEEQGIYQMHLHKADIFRSAICRHITEVFEETEKLMRD
jgi:phosphate starvation-inducible PhoH-like protein